MAPNQKAKRDVQKLTIEDKPVVSMIDKDGPIVDSPVAIDPGERYPEGPSRQDSLSSTAPSEHKEPCESPYCKHCGRGLGDYPTNVLPNNDNPFSGL